MTEDFWTSLGVVVTRTTPEDHDKDSVYSQAFTYTLARMILEMKLPPVTFTTRSYDRLVEIAAFSVNDSEQLFHDMLFYNPYLSEMLAKFDNSIQATMTLAHNIRLEQNTAQTKETTA
jgi:prephenate dehydrogenase